MLHSGAFFMGRGNVVTILGLGLASLSVAPAAVAQASAGARSAATELFDTAQRLEKGGKYAEACPKYQESYRLDPQLGALLHASDCLEKNNQVASAYASWREAAELAAQRSDDRASIAQEHVTALEPRVSRLTVEVPRAAQLPGLKVTSDGLLLAASSFGVAIPVDGGEHDIEATAPGYRTWHHRVIVSRERANERVQVPALESDPNAAAETPADGAARPASPSSAPSASTDALRPAPPRDSGSGSAQAPIGYVLGGLGVVGVGVGTAFLMKRNGKAEDSNNICPTRLNCPTGSAAQADALNSEARSAQTVSMIAFIAGGVALSTGIVLVLSAPRSDSLGGRASLQVLPALGPGSGGLLAQGRF
ncbi:MAG TPA: hypothetical protein VNG33_04605 [Polyangiaceae bacterium]|nr:hypothetical protein [Polyangiaceae bacterium]